MQRSEIAQIKQKIADEYLAAKQGLSGLASGTSQHKMITARTENIGKYHEQLAKLVGAQEAIQIITETLQAL